MVLGRLGDLSLMHNTFCSRIWTSLHASAIQGRVFTCVVRVQPASCTPTSTHVWHRPTRRVRYSFVCVCFPSHVSGLNSFLHVYIYQERPSDIFICLSVVCRVNALGIFWEISVPYCDFFSSANHVRFIRYCQRL